MDKSTACFGASLGSSFCSGFDVRFLNDVRSTSLANLCCDMCSVFCFVRVFSVEKLWESLGERLLKSCGKVSTSWQNCEFCTLNSRFAEVFHGFVEKFSYKFSTLINRGKAVVLHSFHRAYYNYYYYIREFLDGTAKVSGRIRKVNI